ncbi:hypothetical protein [Pulveribacter sp.]|uniref:hypothetical protein n=1 Tax=Pulveribacter sp. TaxID=2678893 RepID=UPI0028A1D36F|nr:hypothetical protein [Pulveribacter sp.]
MTPLWRTDGADGALVLLPGAQMGAADMARAGLPDVLAASGVRLDLFAPELPVDLAHVENTVRLLARDVLPPLRQRYRRLWLGGISMGGLLALAQAQCDPAGLAGLCLLAPYPGSRLTTNAIARAGGLDAWLPTPAQAGDLEFQLWQGLREGRPDLPVFLGIGREDRFADAMLMLARRLPRAALHEVPGGHGWDAWLPLCHQFLRWLALQEQEQER